MQQKSFLIRSNNFVGEKNYLFRLTRAGSRIWVCWGPVEAIHAGAQQSSMTRALGVIWTHFTWLTGICALVVTRFTSCRKDSRKKKKMMNMSHLCNKRT